MVESFSLYNGDVTLEFNPGNHKYHAVIKGRRHHVTSVTTALESLAKPALIPWAVNCAIDFIRPAIQPGVEHAESYLEEVYARAKREHRAVKADAADIGTQAHTILERYPDCGTLPDGPVARCVAGGVAWLQANDIRWMVRECPVYSRRHRFSGRLDGLAEVNGVPSLIDWKSSKFVYPEYRLQTAAYVRAWEEEHPDQPIQQRILIRLGKEDGAFEPHVYDRKSLRKDFAAFLAALRIHQRMREIETESRHKKSQPEVK